MALEIPNKPMGRLIPNPDMLWYKRLIEEYTKKDTQCRNCGAPCSLYKECEYCGSYQKEIQQQPPPTQTTRKRF